MVKIDVSYDASKSHYTPNTDVKSGPCSRQLSIWSALSGPGWIIPDTLSTLVDSVRQIEKSFHIDTGIRGVCNTAKLTEGLEAVSLGYEFVYLLTATPKEVIGNLYSLCCDSKSDKIDCIASLLGEASNFCGAIKFLHHIKAVNITYLVVIVEVAKYGTGTLACALRIYSTWSSVQNERPKDQTEAGKAAHQARLTAKNYSYWSNGSLGLLYTSLLIGKGVKMTPYIFLGVGLATSITFIATHIKTQQADYAEEEHAAREIAPAA